MSCLLSSRLQTLEDADTQQLTLQLTLCAHQVDWWAELGFIHPSLAIEVRNEHMLLSDYQNELQYAEEQQTIGLYEWSNPAVADIWPAGSFDSVPPDTFLPLAQESPVVQQLAEHASGETWS